MPEIRKLSYKQQLKQSEGRNLGLVEYIQTLEEISKQVLLITASTFDDIGVILTPEGERMQQPLAAICTLIAPVCSDVEDIKLPPPVIAKMVKEGGKVIAFNQPEQPESETEQ